MLTWKEILSRRSLRVLSPDRAFDNTNSVFNVSDEIFSESIKRDNYELNINRI